VEAVNVNASILNFKINSHDLICKICTICCEARRSCTCS
jgi:hypothetical protein